MTSYYTSTGRKGNEAKQTTKTESYTSGRNVAFYGNPGWASIIPTGWGKEARTSSSVMSSNLTAFTGADYNGSRSTVNEYKASRIVATNTITKNGTATFSVPVVVTSASDKNSGDTYNLNVGRYTYDYRTSNNAGIAASTFTVKRVTAEGEVGATSASRSTSVATTRRVSRFTAWNAYVETA